MLKGVYLTLMVGPVVPVPVPESVLRADQKLLATEVRDLMDPVASWDQYLTEPPLTEKITPLSPRQAKHLFLNFYESIKR